MARIEAHLAALPKRDAGDGVAAGQIAAALTTKLRTAYVATIGENTLLDAEAALMKLSDVIAFELFHHPGALRSAA